MAKRAAKALVPKAASVSTIQVLAIDSNHEPITKPVYDYREAVVYPYMTSRGLVITKLQGSLARRHYVVEEATKPDVQYLTGVGHGLFDTYTGDYGEILFQIGHYDAAEVEGKIIHLISCQAGRDLGPDFVKNGCQAFFGYDENFSYLADKQELFFECDSEIDKGFADGLTAEEVFVRVKQRYDDKIEELETNGSQKSLYTASFLETNRDHLRCPSSGGKKWGDTSARLH